MSVHSTKIIIYSEYEESSGIDLIKIEIEALADITAKILRIDNKKVRVDSLMVSSSCKKLSRLELVYSVNYRLIKDLNKYNKSLIPQECLVYLEKGNKNIYKLPINEQVLRVYHLYLDEDIKLIIGLFAGFCAQNYGLALKLQHIILKSY